MRPSVNIALTVGTVMAMTPEQLLSLQKYILADGLWENVNDDVYISGGDYLGVQIPGGIFIGIEKDGYTHS